MNTQQLSKWSDTALTVALLFAASVLVVIALWRGHPLFKAVALAWVVLP